ncbi:MAG: formyltetrahydrofolate deformylase [Verrucomicrobiota bacterium]
MKKSRYLVLTLIGKDRSGVVAAFTQTLFQHGANIESLEEQVVGGRFSMNLLAFWPETKSPKEELRTELKRLAHQFQMDLTLRDMKPRGEKRAAVLVTKETHCAERLLQEAKAGKMEIGVMIGNHPDLEPLARKFKIPFIHLPFQARVQAEHKLLEYLEEHQIDYIVLARFMKILSPNFVWRWKNKIINIHPSLLPSFPGASPYRQAFEKGVRVVGVTAHFVTPDLDNGPIMEQLSFSVKPGESLESIIQRGQAIESECLWKAVQLFLKRDLDVHWGKVHLV